MLKLAGFCRGGKLSKLAQLLDHCCAAAADPLLCVISAVEPERPMPSRASTRGSRTSAATCPRTGLPSWPFSSSVLSSVGRHSWQNVWI